MARKKIKEVEATMKTSQIIEIKERFAYRFGYEMPKESLKAFKNRTLSAIASVVGDIASALKLSGVNAVICSTSSGYKFYPASERFLDEKLVIDVLNWLSKYDKAKEQFEKALQLILKGQNNRQVVDCLRLSLELFLKQYLNNNKSLEN